MLLFIKIEKKMSDEIIMHIQKLMTKLLKKEQITNYTLDIKSGSKKGDGFMSFIYRITAKGEDQQKQEWNKNFVAKVAIQDETTRNMFANKLYFEAEIYIYTKVFPAFFDFQEKKQLIKFEHVAKCFLTDFEEGKETLIFEDLKENGFDLWNRKLPMPEIHILELLKIYSYFHAISFALRDQEPKIFEDILKGLVYPLDAWIENGPTKKLYLNAFNWYVPYIEENTSKNISAEYKKMIENWDMLMSGKGNESNPQMVIAHGDSWCNNIMFKNKQNGSIETRLLDFQFSRLTSPVVDISYLFFTSATGEMLNNFDDYMNVYYDSFSGFLKELGSDPNNLFTYEDFREHLKRYGKIGLLISSIIIRLLHFDDDEIPDLKENQETNCQISEIKAKLKVQQIFKDNLVLAHEKGML